MFIKTANSMHRLYKTIASIRPASEIANFSFANAVILISATFSVVLFVSTYSTLPGLLVFGHDEVHYYRDFSFKLIEDGRWLNYLLHDLLRSVSLGVWSVLLLLSVWILFFNLGMSITRDIGYSVIISSTISLSYPFVEQSLWPATTIPAVVILLVISWLVSKGVSHFKIYLFGGALLFGTMQIFYFLLPLFFLGSFVNERLSVSRQSVLALQHIAYWVAGAFAGVMVMVLFVYLKTGHLGVKPAAWRQTMPAHNITELLGNIIYVKNAFTLQLSNLFRISVGDGIYFLPVLFALIIFQIQKLCKSFHILAILFAVCISFFVFSIPLAAVIQSRSLVALTAASILFFVVLHKPQGALRLLSIFFLLMISINYAKFGADYLNRHKSQTEFFHGKIKNMMPSYPSSYSALVLMGSIDNNTPEAQVFNSPPLMHAIIYSLGARDFWDCRQGLDRRCDDLPLGDFIKREPLSDGNLVFSVNKDNVGIITYAP